MNRLFLLRHATATPAYEAVDEAADYARRLTARGNAEARQAASRLVARLGDTPLLILCSPACRTRETAQAVLDALPAAQGRIVEEASLYNASEDTILEAVQLYGAGPAIVVVGHNPGLYHLAIDLAGAGIDTPGLEGLAHGFEPSALAGFECSADWACVKPATATLRAFITP